MRFYTQQHDFYCGIDLHARSMYLCILDREGKIVLHHNMPSAPEPLLQAIAPYRANLVVGVECIFCWYWLAELCAAEKIAYRTNRLASPSASPIRPCKKASRSIWR